MPGKAAMEQEQTITYESVRIGLASPEKIREWSYGEVKKPETINYRTLKPEMDGLFCERIFGPVRDWECHCGYCKKSRKKGQKCPKCGTEVTKSIVRRERMGHIELAAPVSHIWYFKGNPCRMGVLLNIAPRELDRVLYFASYIVLDPGNTDLQKKAVISQGQYDKTLETFKDNLGSFRVGMGAEAIQELLREVDLDAEYTELREALEGATGQKQKNIIKKLEVVEAFRNGNNKPEWMILNVLPVIPPDLRPMVPLEGGRYAVSDLNDLYRRIINRNNRLKNMLNQSVPDLIIRNEKRMLQEAVDSLIDNGKHGRAITGPGNRNLKSLSELLKGKQGRFRQNLLGKRVDYSGRSVIVVGPELKIYQCGLPKEMALELFKPYVMKVLTEKGIANNIKDAKKKVDRADDPKVWDVLEEVIREHPVMLNRAPTLHRLGIQAFEPILVEGKAIKLHPLVCTAFNADFDGDQMAVHLPISIEAQAECRFLLLSPNNLLKPSDGGVVSVPTQDMILGIYYLTNDRYREVEATEDEIVKVYDADDEGANIQAIIEDAHNGVVNAHDKIKVRVIGKSGKGGRVIYYRDIISTVLDMIGRKFKDQNRALLAYENHEITLQQPIYVERSATMEDGEVITGMVKTTLGKLIFNEVIPQDLGFIDRTDRTKILEPEVNVHIEKKWLKKILNKCINIHGSTRTAEVLDEIKAIGYKYSTLSGITVSVADMTVPEQKEKILQDAQDVVDRITYDYEYKGFLTDKERYNSVIETWKNADDELTRVLLDGLDRYNNIYMMANSGARGSDKQIKQLAGMRGNMADTSGRTIELPVKSNFREGMDVLEYFISAHGARKGLSDTALRTADSGYLTRRLVDVAQELIISDVDCCSTDGDNTIPEGVQIPGISVSSFWTNEKNEGERRIIEEFQERITGRYTAEDVKDEEGVVLVRKNHMITPDRAEMIVHRGVDSEGVRIWDSETGTARRDAKMKVRSILTCRAHVGVCAKCYGMNLATGQPVQVGEAVGVIAAQSIGEPGTQLTMRTFHTGGVAGGDITQGLPRVEELFEARKPKGLAIISEISGTVSITNASESAKKIREVTVTAETDDGKISKTYGIPYDARIKVFDGQQIESGDELTEGSVNPHDILKIKGVEAVQNYMLREVQRVYRLQGVEINDKHIEVIVHQMLRNVKIESGGDSRYLPGAFVEARQIEEINEHLIEEGMRPVEATPVLLGITKASLSADSFLAAASFQETARKLTDAAVENKVDELKGIKENVILGKLIPAGTGAKRYNMQYIHLSSDTVSGFDEDEELFDDESVSGEGEDKYYSEEPIPGAKDYAEETGSEEEFIDEEIGDETAEEAGEDIEEFDEEAGEGSEGSDK